MAERTNGKVAPDRILCFYAGMNFLEKADNRIVLHIRSTHPSSNCRLRDSRRETRRGSVTRQSLRSTSDLLVNHIF